MQTPRLILLLLIVVELTGCNAGRLALENGILTQQVSQLTREIETRQIEMDYAEQQAAIAAGCDAYVPLCYYSITAAGHRAQVAGYSGGSSWIYWVIIFLKFAIPGISIAGTVTAIRLLHIRFIHPAKAELDRANRIVGSVEAEVVRAWEQVATARSAFDDLRDQIAQSRNALSELRDQLAAEKVAAEQQETSTVQAQAGHHALEGFE